MKKYAAFFLLFVFLTGCSSPPDEIQLGIELRSKLLQATTCSFDCQIAADYGDKIYKFALNCTANSEGDVSFTVTEPDTISGISGNLSGDGGNLTFDDTALHFALMADNQLSPISAPWVLIKALRSGYMTSACTEDGCILLSIDDSYEDNSLRLDIWLNPQRIPNKADILFDGRRILSVSVENFKIL